MDTYQSEKKSISTITTKDDSTSHVEYLDAKSVALKVEEVEEDASGRPTRPLTTARDFVTEILLVEDDPTQNPWTFRMWFIGIGMSVFAG
jgi:hypothetical protein